MNEFFSATPNEPLFSLFSLMHIIPLIILVGLVALLITFKEQIKKHPKEHLFRYGLALTLLICDLSIYVWRIGTGTFSVSYALPLHLCTITAYSLMFVLITKNKTVFGFIFYAGLAGAIMAILYPDFGRFNYTQYRYYEFMIIHTTLILGLLYMVFIHDFVPRFHSLVKSYIVVHIYAIVIIIPFNYLFDGTYMMLVNNNAAILEVLGPWPMTAIVLEFLLLILFGLAYLTTYLLVLRNEPKHD